MADPATQRHEPWQLSFPLFYSPDTLSERMLHSAQFDAISAQPGFYGRWPGVADAAYADPKWQAEQIYQISFPPPTSEVKAEWGAADVQTKPLHVYPQDAFAPSTSVAGGSAGLEYRMNPAACYPNALFGTAYDYPQMPFTWKMNGVTVKSEKLTATKVVVPTGPGTNNVRVRTAEKYRMVYSDFQRLELEKEFITNNFITADRKSVLSTQLNLTERQIKIWFQNRRAKGRREQQKHKSL